MARKGWFLAIAGIGTAVYQSCPRHKSGSYEDVGTRQWPIVYSSCYDIRFLGLEKLHVFDSRKWGKIYQNLLDEKIFSQNDTVRPYEVKEEDLLVVHSKRYLDTLKESSTIANITEIWPLRWLPAWFLDRTVLTPLRYQTGGTLLAAKLAVSIGWAINIGGGFHHSCEEMGGGFCVYADISLALKNLFLGEHITKAMIVDLDAHQGNGHERDFLGDGRVYILDVYNASIYPRDSYAKAGISREVKIQSGITDEEYLNLVKINLREALKEFRPDIVLYNAGTDILSGDPLGKMDISAEGIIQRDELVFKEVRRGTGGPIPIVMVTSGGYQQITARIVSDSVLNLIKKGLIGGPESTTKCVRTCDILHLLHGT